MQISCELLHGHGRAPARHAAILIGRLDPGQDFVFIQVLSLCSDGCGRQLPHGRTISRKACLWPAWQSQGATVQAGAGAGPIFIEGRGRSSDTSAAAVLPY